MISSTTTLKSWIKQQRGSTLLVALIMLALLTLVAVSAINSTTTSLQMVGNAQFSEEADAAAQQAIENVISTGDFKSTPPAPQNIDVNNDGVADYTVKFEPYTQLQVGQAGCCRRSGRPECMRQFRRCGLLLDRMGYQCGGQRYQNRCQRCPAPGDKNGCRLE